MLVVTADRPWELYDAAAPQTIDQAKLFGGFVRHYAELGLPDAAPSAIRAVPRIAAQAVARALGPTPGPVHVNARFRKPLDPVDVPGPEPWEPLVASLLARGAPAVSASPPAIDPSTVPAMAARIARAERGLLVAGPASLAQAEPAARDAILALARRTGFPLLAESTSQLLFVEEHRASGVVPAFDSILRTAAFRAGPAPDLIVQIGAPPTSSAYADMVASLPDTARVVVAPHGWNDPHGDASMVVLAEPAAFARALCEAVPETREVTPWRLFFDFNASEALQIALHESRARGLTEGAVACAVVRSCPEGAILVAGNSSPVRDLDAYCGPSQRSIRVAHQRGASGIDGLVSGAAGVASVEKGPVALLLGDVSLTHDLGALALLARATTPLVAVVVQNGGGRIFDRLPVASRVDPSVFDRCFATPQAVRFDRAAEAFGVPYVRAETREALDEALAAAWARPGATLVEAVTPPGEGARSMARINERLGQRADSMNRFVAMARGGS